MKRNIKPLTPRCGLCKRLYSYRDDDGSGLCPKCRPVTSQPILAVQHLAKQTIIMEVGKPMMDDFDKEELREQEAIQEEAKEIQDIPESQESQEAPLPIEDISSSDSIENAADTAVEEAIGELKIEDIIEPGRYGVSNSQMIPAMKKAIAEQSIEKLALLKKTYFYTFEKSIRYLKKAEREYIANNLK